jgi:hypothetical protein
VSLEVNFLTANDAGFDSNLGTWVAGSNTSVARTTAHFQGSPASMRMTSAAAGTLAAFSGKYGVAPNTEYEAYCVAGNAVAAAGRIVSLKIDWYTSGDVYISSSTTTTPETLPNSTAFAGPIVVVGTSPATAAKASLQVNVTAGITAGSQAVDVDTFGFGEPVQDAGNLLSYNVASIEMDTSGWTVSNGTLARSTTGPSEGIYSLRATSTASGDMTVTTAARVAVTAGTAYEMYPWVLPPAAGRSLILEVRWYDAAVAGTLLSTSSHTVSTIQTTIPERHTVLGTAPVGATHAEVRLRPQTTGAGEIWYFDRITLRVQPLVPGNLLSYAAQDIEVDASDWTAVTNCTLARSAPGERSYSGAYSLKATVTANSQARIEAAALVPVTEGTYYNAQLSFYPVGATLAACWVDIDWYDASMVYLGSAQPDQDSDDDGDQWRFDLIGRKAPAGAAWARMVLLPQPGVAGHVFFLDQMSLVAGTPPYDLLARPDTGSVTITLNNLAGSTTVDLYRVDPDGSLAPVRGFVSDVVGYAVTGPVMIFEDYEAPLGVPLRYQYTKHPSESSTRTFSVTVDPPADSGYIWLTDPGQPPRNLLLMVGEAPDWKRAVERGIYRVRGAKRPVVVSDVRGDLEGDLDAVTFTEAERNALHFLLDEGSVLLIRARPGWGLDKAYVSVGDVSENRVSRHGAQWAREWTLPLTIVDRPTGGMAGSAGRSWQDVLDDPETPTWGDLPAKYPNWLSVFQGVD